VASQPKAQFTPDGTLKFTIKIASAESILETLRDLLEELQAQETYVNHSKFRVVILSEAKDLCGEERWRLLTNRDGDVDQTSRKFLQHLPGYLLPTQPFTIDPP
jgi:hypothetical protein